MKRTYKCMDLFCGAGGMSYGFERAGIETVFAVENNPTYARSFSSNFPNAEMYVGDIRGILDEQIEIINRKHNVDMIIGGPPCQGFSLAGNIGRRFLDDERNKLFLDFVRFVRVVKPKMFVLENVAAMLTHNNGKTIVEIVEKFGELGYTLKWNVLNAAHYGVPQERRRIFIVGTAKGYSFEFPREDMRMVTIREAIGDLPVLASGEKSDIPLHNAMRHSAQMLEKMGYVRDGGDRYDIPEVIRPQSGDIRKYIRYNSERPSFCVTGDMRKIFHYEQNRALTCRELARLQTFPDSYVFCGNSIQIQQQIGNAVPCRLAQTIALSCVRTLNHEQ